jgi:CHAD domain-containing protein
MAYRIDAGQPIPDEIRRVFFEEIDSAVKQLTTHPSKDRDESIHEARKSLKKLRALLRLVTPLIGNETYRKENQALRGVGRKLSHLRDARATIEIFEAVVKEAEARKTLDGSLIQSIRSRLEEHKSQTEQRIDIEETLRSAVAALQSVRGHVDEYQLSPGGFEDLERGLKNVYRRGQKAMKKAVKTSAADNFHNWRKRVKDHWYHMRLLGALDTAFVETREEDLRKLETWLGDDHNLVVLRDTINSDGARFGHPKQVRQFLALIKQHGQELREKALGLGEYLYGLKPKRLITELGKAREIWPAESKNVPARVGNLTGRQPRKRPASAPAPRSHARARA